LWEWAALALLLAVFAAQALLASPQKSASFDEQYHLTAGYSYWRTGDFRLATTHPPLAGLIAGLPLLGRGDINLPLDDPLWAQGNRYDFSDVFLWRANADPQGILVAARGGMIALGVLLLVGVFFWGRRLLGAAGGWLALLLAVFDPNLIANSRIISTDLPLTAFFFLAAWRLWCWLERRRGYDVVLAGVLGGLAMAAKYNGLLFWPVAAAAVLLYHPRPEFRIAKDSWWRRLAGVAGAGVIGLLVLWGVYRFTWGVPQHLPLGLPLPAPFFWDNLWITFGGLVQETTVKPDFLLGQVSTGGWWYYFPVAIAVKTPLPLLMLLVAGLFVLLRRHEGRRQSLLWLPALAFVLMGLTGVLTIGYRHMLPAVPFVILLAGNAAAFLPRRLRVADFHQAGVQGRPAQAPSVKKPIASMPDVGARQLLPGALVVLLVGVQMLRTLSFYPHQEAFFNVLGGPWQNWSNILVDSNLDWGQDLPALRAVMDARGIDSVNLAYFGKAVPEAYGVRYRPLPGYLRFMDGRELAAYNPYTPPPGWYAISATSLRLGSLQPDTTDLYAFFRDLTPAERAGYSIYLYEVADPEDAEIVRPVVTDTPVYEVPPADLGITGAQRAAVKWRQEGGSTIYPGGQDFAPPAEPAYHPIGADLGGVFTLLGYALDRPTATRGEDLGITLYWQAGSTPMPQPAPTRGEPISAFVHVVDGDPANQVAQADGWEVALRGLESGDVIAQRFTLGFGPDVAAKEYTLLAGLYSPQDGARLPVTQEGLPPADHANLGAIQITE
jgi:hypothetical protein